MDLSHLVELVQGSGLTVLTDVLAVLGALSSLFHVFHADGASALFDKLSSPLKAAAAFFKGSK